MDSRLQPFEHTLIQIVKQDVVPALGCTEPISLALASATAAKYLGHSNIEKIDAKLYVYLLKRIRCVCSRHRNGGFTRLLPPLVPSAAMLTAV